MNYYEKKIKKRRDFLMIAIKRCCKELNITE